MLNAILLGLGYGFGLAFLPGPAFFKLIQTSLEKGFVPAAYVAAGVAISDIIYVFLVYFGISTIIDNQTFRFFLGASGGFILVAFGLTSIFKQGRIKGEAIELPDSSQHIRLLLKGIAINFLNPGALLFWLATVSAAHINTSDKWQHFGFFAAILLSVFTTDILKSALAQRISYLFTEKLMRRLNWVIGISLMLFGLKMLFETFFVNNQGFKF